MGAPRIRSHGAGHGTGTLGTGGWAGTDGMEEWKKKQESEWGGRRRKSVSN